MTRQLSNRPEWGTTSGTGARVQIDNEHSSGSRERPIGRVGASGAMGVLTLVVSDPVHVRLRIPQVTAVTSHSGRSQSPKGGAAESHGCRSGPGDGPASWVVGLSDPGHLQIRGDQSLPIFRHSAVTLCPISTLDAYGKLESGPGSAMLTGDSRWPACRVQRQERSFPAYPSPHCQGPRV